MTRLRNHLAFVLALPLLAALYLWMNGYDGLGTARGDGLIYFLTAWHYAPWAETDPLAVVVARDTQFPPVYPFLLMAFGTIYSFLAAHLLTAGFLLCGFVAFYAWLVSLGIDRTRAGLGAALFGLLPGTFLNSLYLHPEGLYIALAFAAFVLLESGERTAKVSHFWWASAAIAVAFVTRTVGLTLVPALGIALLRNRPRGWQGMLVLAVAPAVTWGLVHHPEKAYSEALAKTYDLHRPLDAVFGDVIGFVQAAIDGLAWNLVYMNSLRLIGLTLCGVAMGVALWRFVRGKADAWYLLAYLGVMALWPYPQEDWRLMWVVVPVLLGYFLWVGEWMWARAAALSGPVRAALAWGPVLALALVVLPGSAAMIKRATQAPAAGDPALRYLPEWYLPDPREAYHLALLQIELVKALREFSPLIPEDQCVFSIAHLVTAYFTDRNTDLPPADNENFEYALHHKGCRYFIMSATPARLFPEPYHPRRRLGDRIRIIAEHRMPGADPASEPEFLLGVLRAD